MRGEITIGSKFKVSFDPMARKTIKVVEKKLGRERARGTACSETGEIEIDPRLDSKTYMGTTIHEWLHIEFPDMAEEKVLKLERRLRDLLWERGFRRIHK